MGKARKTGGNQIAAPPTAEFRRASHLRFQRREISSTEQNRLVEGSFEISSEHAAKLVTNVYNRPEL